MPLNKHQIEGIGFITDRPAIHREKFEELMGQAGYLKIYSAPTKKKRQKIWWRNSDYRLVLSVYHGTHVVTAYHPDPK